MIRTVVRATEQRGAADEGATRRAGTAYGDGAPYLPARLSPGRAISSRNKPPSRAAAAQTDSQCAELEERLVRLLRLVRSGKSAKTADDAECMRQHLKRRHASAILSLKARRRIVCSRAISIAPTSAAAAGAVCARAQAQEGQAS